MLELCRCPNIYGPDCKCPHIEIYGHTPNWNLSRRSVLNGRTVEMGRDNNAYETLCTVFHSAGGHIIY